MTAADYSNKVSELKTTRARLKLELEELHNERIEELAPFTRGNRLKIELFTDVSPWCQLAPTLSKGQKIIVEIVFRYLNPSGRSALISFYTSVHVNGTLEDINYRINTNNFKVIENDN